MGDVVRLKVKYVHMAMFVVSLPRFRVRDLGFFPGRYCSLGRDFERLVVKRSQDQDTNTLPPVRRVSGVRACVSVSARSLPSSPTPTYRLVPSAVLSFPVQSCPVVSLSDHSSPSCPPPPSPTPIPIPPTTPLPFTAADTSSLIAFATVQKHKHACYCLASPPRPVHTACHDSNNTPVL
jgi:hypothetical protein